MRAEEIRKAMNAAPFRKFTLHLASGRKFPVGHRDFISIDPKGRTVVVFQLSGDWEAIDVPLINSIEFHAGKNGRRHKAG
jgi:hypothetical protein